MHNMCDVVPRQASASLSARLYYTAKRLGPLKMPDSRVETVNADAQYGVLPQSTGSLTGLRTNSRSVVDLY